MLPPTPTSAMAADTELWSGDRFAIAICTGGLPVATASTRSASTSNVEYSSTQVATSGWSAASPRMTAGGAFSLNASARASSARTSGDGSSSSMISAPSAAARSSGERSE